MLDLLRDPDIYMNRTIIFVYEAYLDSISKLAFLSQVHSRTENLGFFLFCTCIMVSSCSCSYSKQLLSTVTCNPYGVDYSVMVHEHLYSW